MPLKKSKASKTNKRGYNELTDPRPHFLPHDDSGTSPQIGILIENICIC